MEKEHFLVYVRNRNLTNEQVNNIYNMFMKELHNDITNITSVGSDEFLIQLADQMYPKEEKKTETPVRKKRFRFF